MQESLKRAVFGNLLPLTLSLVALVGVGITSPARGTADPVRVAEVTISLPVSTWTHVNAASPNTSYWTYPRDAIRVGRVPSEPGLWRGFVQADIQPLHGRTIIDATLQIVLDHSASCNPTPVELWQVGVTVTPSVTWNTQGPWLSPISQAYAAANQSCGQPDSYISFVGTGVTSTVAQAAAMQHPTVTMGLRAQDESTWTQWKKFRPTNIWLVVRYAE
ncbi:MAG TPA: hypothetical protein VF062_15620 [Candidatus Limnocylindrales bacterium]